MFIHLLGGGVDVDDNVDVLFTEEDVLLSVSIGDVSATVLGFIVAVFPKVVLGILIVVSTNISNINEMIYN